MVNLIIIHGVGGYPEENWFSWLKKEMEELTMKVYVPKFPIDENQNLDGWLKEFKNYEQYLDENTIIVGHSLGCAFTLRVLERFDKKIKAAILVAGFIGKLNSERFDPIIESFMKDGFNWNKINENCKNFVVINSENDPYVPIAKGAELVSHLNTGLNIIKDGGHFNTDSGYKTFPVLAKMIPAMMTSRMPNY